MDIFNYSNPFFPFRSTRYRRFKSSQKKNTENAGKFFFLILFEITEKNRKIKRERERKGPRESETCIINLSGALRALLHSWTSQSSSSAKGADSRRVYNTMFIACQLSRQNISLEPLFFKKKKLSATVNCFQHLVHFRVAQRAVHLSSQLQNKRRFLKFHFYFRKKKRKKESTFQKVPFAEHFHCH